MYRSLVGKSFSLRYLLQTSCNISLWPIKNFARPYHRPRENDFKYIELSKKIMWSRPKKVVTDPKVLPPTSISSDLVSF